MHHFAHHRHITNIFLFLLSVPAFAAGFSPVRTEQVSGTQTLSVRSIAQDDKKEIWFGTDKNLYRYDGYSPTLCVDRERNNDHFQINDLVCAGDRVLLGCVGGFVVYDSLEGTFSWSDVLAGKEVSDLYRQGETVWIGTSVGLYRYDVRTGEVSAVALEGGSNIRSLAISGDELFLGTRKPASVRIYGLTDLRLHEVYGEREFPSDYEMIDAIEALDETRLIVGSSSALFEIDRPARRVRPLYDFPWVKTLYREDDGFLVGTDNGLYTFSLAGESAAMQMDNVIWRIFRDVDDNLWLGSDTGLLLCRNNRLVSPLPGVPEGAHNLFSSICGDGRGRFFAGGSHGMLVFGDGPEAGEPVWYKMGDARYPIAHNKIRQIKKNPFTGRIWAETAGGMVSYDPQTLRFRQVTMQNQTHSNSFDILFERDRYWIASFSGLACFRHDQLVDAVTLETGLSTNQVAQIAKDRTDHLWIRTNDRNVWLYDETNKRPVLFYPKGLGPSSVWDLLYADGSGDIWLTSANRICKVEPALSRELLAAEYVLPGRERTEVKALVEVENTLWIASSQGLFLLDKASGAVFPVAADGNYVSLCYDKPSGLVYLGSLDRIDRIRYQDALSWIHRPARQLHITRIQVNEEETVPAREYADATLTLPPNHNNIYLYFSDFDYSASDLSRFRFYLNGNPDRWFSVGGDGNRVFLPNLSPGRHKIYVAGFNGGEGRLLLSVRILRPWYASTAAFILYALLAVWLVYISLRLYLSRKRLHLERLQRSREIAQAKSKIEFFADVSHEFKTPLSMILAPVSILLGEERDERKRQALQLVQDSAKKINSLIHLSLDYYNDKAETGDSVSRSALELVGFSRQILKVFEENFPKLEFQFVSDAPALTLELDAVKMETILTNIISNACKYTPDGGSVILSLSQDRQSGLLSVKISDTGVGIPAEDLPYIFQRYFQSSRTKGNKEGTGVGLSIVKKYVELLDGKIVATSDGTGTTFHILLPVSAPEAVSAEEQTAGGKLPQIVIVDDNKTICDFLSGVLRERYECLCAHDGETGLRLCREVQPDLIIADVVMPGMDGLEMCRRVRALPELSIVPIILLTAKDDRETEKRSINLNIDAFFGKPFDMGTLSARIDQLIAKNRRVVDKVRLEMIATPEMGGEMSADEKILGEITGLIEKHLDDAGFSVDRLCALSGYSEKSIYRRIKRLTGLSTVEYIRSIRMKKAALLLQNGNFTVSEAMYMVGFTNTSYFSRAFCAQFGKTPREYRQAFRQDAGDAAEE